MARRIKRRFLREKEAQKLLSRFFSKTKTDHAQWPDLKPPVERAEVDEQEVFLINEKPIIAKSNDDIFPTLSPNRFLSILPRAMVDMGAIPHICNGADIMAPGITNFEGDFDNGDIVVIIDKRHQKPVAIALALHNAEQARKLKKGKVFRNVHYVGDKLWSAIRQITQT